LTAWQLAQVNIGRLLAPVSDPRIDDFRNALDRINALAESQPGFVWRLTGEGNDATDIRPDEADPLLAINVSVWESAEHLAAFVYRSEHREFVRRRHEWFEPARAAIFALWWVPTGYRPTVPECLERVWRLRADGPTPYAFDFKHRFDAPATQEAAA
jgi:heme-degrading monooxygenase HmoA